MVKQTESKLDGWVQARADEWHKRKADVKKWEGRIREHYKKSEMVTGAFASWGMEGVEAERRALDSVLSMDSSEVLKLLSKKEGQIDRTDIKFWETYEWPKQMIGEILGFCRDWVDMTGNASQALISRARQRGKT